MLCNILSKHECFYLNILLLLCINFENAAELVENTKAIVTLPSFSYHCHSAEVSRTESQRNSTPTVCTEP